MKQTLSNRALITLGGSGVDLHGTFHLPSGHTTDSDLCNSTTGRTAVLIVNALAAPRAGYGDSAVYWADSFARVGIPCFRFDLPGLGDTRGDLPAELLTFITDGGYAALIEQKAKELVARFHLRGVILMGHCAGAVTALYGASDQKLCKGLILMDPYFNHARRITKILPRLAEISRGSRAYEMLRKTYDMAREFPRVGSKDALPGNANLALLAQWKRVASGGLPILILGSPGLRPIPGQFDYMKYAVQMAGRKAQVTVAHIEETDHSFANRDGRDAVRQHAESWFRTLPNIHLSAVGPASFQSLPDAAPARSADPSTLLAPPPQLCPLPSPVLSIAAHQLQSTASAPAPYRSLR